MRAVLVVAAWLNFFFFGVQLGFANWWAAPLNLAAGTYCLWVARVIRSEGGA